MCANLSGFHFILNDRTSLKVEIKVGCVQNNVSDLDSILTSNVLYNVYSRNQHISEIVFTEI